MSTTSFRVQKASFMASWTVLVDNYMARKSDDKLDSLEKTLSWMLQTGTTLRRQAIVTRNNKRKKNCNEKEIGDTILQSPQQTLSSLHPFGDVFSFSQPQEQHQLQEPRCSQDVAQTSVSDILSQSWSTAADEKWKNKVGVSLDVMDNLLCKINNS